jgi:hypothetical protein
MCACTLQRAHHNSNPLRDSTSCSGQKMDDTLFCAPHFLATVTCTVAQRMGIAMRPLECTCTHGISTFPVSFMCWGSCVGCWCTTCLIWKVTYTKRNGVSTDPLGFPEACTLPLKAHMNSFRMTPCSLLGHVVVQRSAPPCA